MAVLQPTRLQRSSMTFPSRQDLRYLFIRQRDFAEYRRDVLTRNSVEVFLQRRHKNPAQINRRRTHRELTRIEDLQPMFSRRKKIDVPSGLRIMERGDVDQRLLNLRSHVRQKADGLFDLLHKLFPGSAAKKKNIPNVV